MCGGGGWELLGPLTPWASLRVWGERYDMAWTNVSLSFFPSCLTSHPYLSLMVATKGPPTTACLFNREEPAPSGHSEMSQFHLQSGPRTFTGGQPRGPGDGSLLVPFRVGFLSSQHGLFLGKWKRDSEAAGKTLSCC